MKHDRGYWIAWAGDVLAALLTLFLVNLLGGPSWAVFGFATVQFQILRTRSELKMKK